MEDKVIQDINSNDDLSKLEHQKIISLKIEVIKEEVLSLCDIFTFIKNITSRWKKMFDFKIEFVDKEKRIDISIIIFIITLIYPTVIRLFFGIFGFIISYQLYYKYGVSKIKLSTFRIMKNSKVHIHHWLYCSLLLITIYALDISHPFFIGLGFGGIIHGIQFSDWSNILYNLEHL